jgi:hypothetical protein
VFERHVFVKTHFSTVSGHILEYLLTQLKPHVFCLRAVICLQNFLQRFTGAKLRTSNEYLISPTGIDIPMGFDKKLSTELDIKVRAKKRLLNEINYIL